LSLARALISLSFAESPLPALAREIAAAAKPAARLEEIMAPETQSADVTASQIQAPEIRSRIKQIIAGVAGLDPAKIPDHAALREGLHLDSLSLLRIEIDVDSTFELNLPDERYKEIQSLDDMVDLVVHRLAGPEAV
jgi:acyl carrier protein